MAAGCLVFSWHIGGMKGEGLLVARVDNELLTRPPLPLSSAAIRQRVSSYDLRNGGVGTRTAEIIISLHTRIKLALLYFGTRT